MTGQEFTQILKEVFVMERHERQRKDKHTSVFISPFRIACKAIAQRLVPVNKPLFYPSFYFV